MDLFADHGVSGTSLQMIADRMGVTKAAVYHQFHTKDEIVLAVAEREFCELEAALELAEAETSREHARQVLLEEVIGVAVRRRRWVRALQNDPVMIRLLAGHQPLQQIVVRLYQVLLGEGAGPRADVRVALLSSAIAASVVHPAVAGLGDDELRDELLEVARRVFAV
ncbi:MAG TPA: TetR/AcrR family transcriptional regulator [Mycobacteriales bacterium]|nr:TetR/AcrR family transcriptional regulator [Mycobacteriales bacterium]